MIRSRLPAAAALLSGLLLFALPGPAVAGVRRGLLLCGRTLIPALFPYMVISGLLAAQPGVLRLLSLPLRPLCRLMGQRRPDLAPCLLLCLLGGFAPAARFLALAREQNTLSRREAVLLCFCALQASPGFVFALAGPLFGGQAPLLLLGSGALATLGCCLAAPLFCRRFHWDGALPSPSSSRRAEPAVTLPLAIRRAAEDLVPLCGFVVYFSFLGESLAALLPPGPRLRAALFGLLELTGGCEACRALPGLAGLYACRSCLSGLGLCALGQIDSLLPAGLPRRAVLWGRALHLGLSLAALRALTALLPGAVPVWSSLAPRLVTAQRLPTDAALVLFALCCLVLARLSGSGAQGPGSFTFGRSRL